MTDPTPEERAADIAEWGVLWPGRAKMEERITAEIRAAIEGDRRERLTHRIEPGMCGLPVNVCTGQKERIAQLEAQLRDTEQQVLASHQANRELEEKLRERAEDTERLDWLESCNGRIGWNGDSWVAWPSGHAVRGKRGTLREAIDDARAQESSE